MVCSGDVVTMECYEKLIKKDMLHPLTNQKMKEKDIIPMQRVNPIFYDTRKIHTEIVTISFECSRVVLATQQPIQILRARRNVRH